MNNMHMTCQLTLVLTSDIKVLLVVLMADVFLREALKNGKEEES